MSEAMQTKDELEGAYQDLAQDFASEDDAFIRMYASRAARDPDLTGTTKIAAAALVGFRYLLHRRNEQRTDNSVSESYSAKVRLWLQVGADKKPLRQVGPGWAVLRDPAPVRGPAQLVIEIDDEPRVRNIIIDLYDPETGEIYFHDAEQYQSETSVPSATFCSNESRNP